MTNFRFQPTRPLRGATSLDDLFANFDVISTHAPLAGRDRKSHSTSYVPPVFQPTRPLRGATDWSYLVICLYSDFNPRAPCGARRAGGQHRHQGLQISTHAPLAGRDDFPTMVSQSKFAFQPTRPLRGATTCHGRSRRTNIEFQPTRPLRGATSVRDRCP